MDINEVRDTTRKVRTIRHLMKSQRATRELSKLKKYEKIINKEISRAAMRGDGFVKIWLDSYFTMGRLLDSTIQAIVHSYIKKGYDVIAKEAFGSKVITIYWDVLDHDEAQNKEEK